jgi:hypothetical protein
MEYSSASFSIDDASKQFYQDIPRKIELSDYVADHHPQLCGNQHDFWLEPVFKQLIDHTILVGCEKEYGCC